MKKTFLAQTATRAQLTRSRGFTLIEMVMVIALIG
ncbi:prepilin-type N-terminal cleavage/methylation domain-containing protein, partial [Rudaea sp.]